jgi:hypothetical protein
MLESFKHVNSKNEVLDFLQLNIYANENDLRDYQWSYTSNNNKITSFYKGIVKKSIPFIFYVNEAKAEQIKNQFYEHFDYDVLTQQKGYFEINGYKYYCFATKSAKSNYLYSNRELNIKLEVTTDEPFWIKQTTKSINFGVQGESDTLLYTFAYPFTYTNMNSANILNDNFVQSNAIIRIYGYCINPLVSINDNIYQVNTTLESGEYLEIDTENKSIFKYSSVGDKTNLFNDRNKSYDVFKPLDNGTLIVGANDAFKVDIVLIEKRGEPKWI